MPVYRLTASSIISSFRASGKRHLLLTGGRGTGKTTLLRALVPLLCPGTQEITTAAYPADRVEIRESVGGKIAVIGRFDPALPPGENRMRPVADGFLLLGVPALHRMAAGESEWAVLDELGYLENSCPEFRQAVEALLDAKRVLAIVRKQDTPFLTTLCARQDAFVVDLDDPAPALGCVVMASGLGRRFGGNKLMADFCGAPLIANALEYAAQLVRGKVFEVAKREFAAAEKAGLSKILAARKAASKPAEAEEEVKRPPAEPCTASIPGIEVMDLEDAAKVLWKNGIYAETGMGCTGPLVMMSEANHEKALEILKKAGYVG